MSGKGSDSSRLFTVEQANAMLPLVRAITQDLAELATHVVERRQRLESLTAGRQLSPSDPYAAELVEVEKELARDHARLREYVAELRELGVEAKGALEGLVDFPTEIDGRPALLCWKLGEPEILFWHDLESGFAGRQPLYAESAAGSDSAADAADDLTG
jgi:hypothetical protein